MLEFASPFQSGMVLQQNMPIAVWGKADPGRRVVVTFAGQVLGCLTGENGVWHGRFSPVKGSFKEYEMTLSSQGEKITLARVTVGEVWICAGQSNMQYSLKETPQFAVAKLDKDLCRISMLRVPCGESQMVCDSFKGAWTTGADEKTLGNYTAEGWFFGREIYEKMRVPVGLVDISRGGTVLEAWTPKFMYDAEPELFAHQLERIEEAKTLHFAKGAEEFHAVVDVMRHKDVSNDGFPRGWAQPDLPDSEKNGWRPFPVPNFNSILFGDNNGAYWYRKEIEIPAELAGKPLTLELGVIDDLDTTYFNGVQVGAVGADNPAPYDVKRVYPVPAELVKAGRNVIAVRNFDEQQVGGLCGPELKITCADPEWSLDLAGTWQVRAEKILHQIEYPNATFSYYVPSSLFNAMVAPIAGLSVRGVIWHQGENNTWNSEEYEKYFTRMISGWRKAWGRDDLPFIPAQLQGYAGWAGIPAESSWAQVREAIRLSGQDLENVYPITLAGLGEVHDQHFPNKIEAAKRMAYAAFASVYKTMEPDFAYGPMIRRAFAEDNGSVTMEFDHGEELVFPGGDTDQLFAVAGSDGVFYWADSVSPAGKGRLRLTCAAVKSPAKVRYAWANNPKTNLFSGAGMPAYPFECTVEKSSQESSK